MTSQNVTRPRWREIIGLAGFLVVTFLAPLTGAWAAPGDWYRDLAKPSWTPPGWVFGPAWLVLYILMAVAAWGVWRQVGWGAPLGWWFGQLALNAAWTPIFFGLRQPGWAFAEIVLLWLAILATNLQFLRSVRWAGWLMSPYLAWVTFAAALNLSIWRLNR